MTITPPPINTGPRMTTAGAFLSHFRIAQLKDFVFLQTLKLLHAPIITNGRIWLYSSLKM